MELFLIRCQISFKFLFHYKTLNYTFLIKFYFVHFLSSKSLYRWMKNHFCLCNLFQNLMMRVNLLFKVLMRKKYQDPHLTLILLIVLIVFELQDLSLVQATAMCFLLIDLTVELCRDLFQFFWFLFNTIPISSFDFFVCNNNILKWLCVKRYSLSFDFVTCFLFFNRSSLLECLN